LIAEAGVDDGVDSGLIAARGFFALGEGSVVVDGSDGPNEKPKSPIRGAPEIFDAFFTNFNAIGASVFVPWVISVCVVAEVVMGTSVLFPILATPTRAVVAKEKMAVIRRNILR